MVALSLNNSTALFTHNLAHTLKLGVIKGTLDIPICC